MFFCNSLAFNPTIELPELTQDWEIDSWRAQTQPCVNQNPGERSSDPTRDWPRLAPECLGVSCGGVGRLCGCCGVQGHWEGQCLQETFWMKSPLSSLPPPWFGLRSNNGEGTGPAHQQKIGLKVYWAWPPHIRTRPSFPLSQSLPSGSVDKPLILLHQRADWMKTTITEN